MKNLTACLLSFVLSYTANAATALGMNDVSILLPLPAPDQWDLLPAGTTPGGKGDLLPLSYFKSVPQIVGLASNEQVYPALRAVAIRLDPCFAEGFSPTGCRPQIRMIWQVLADNGDSSSTFDAAVHSFYDLTGDEFSQLISRYVEIKQKFGLQNAPTSLGINPHFSEFGLAGDYSRQVLALITSYCGEQNLSRLTFMQLFLNGNIWAFGGLDISRTHAGTPVFADIKIPGTSATLQQFRNNAKPEPVFFSGGLSPVPTLNPEFSYLLNDSKSISLPQNEQQISDAVRAAFKIENPGLNNPGTVDCVSCHTAQTARHWALTQFPQLNLSSRHADVIYNSDRDLTNSSPLKERTNNLRAFGYFMDSPITAQRTINETAEVLRQVNARP